MCSYWITSGCKHYDIPHHALVSLQHNERRRNRIAPNVCLRARSRPALQLLPLQSKLRCFLGPPSRCLTNTSPQIRPGWDIPLNALLVSFVITCLLSLIELGSEVALNAILSLTVGAILSSYIISISCVALRKIRKDHPLPPTRWSLGAAGLPINIIAVAFLLVVYVVSFPLPCWIVPGSDADLQPAVHLLPPRQPTVSFAVVYELELGYVRRNGDCCNCVFPHLGSTRLRWTRGIGEAGFLTVVYNVARNERICWPDCKFPVPCSHMLQAIKKSDQRSRKRLR